MKNTLIISLLIIPLYILFGNDPQNQNKLKQESEEFRKSLHEQFSKEIINVADNIHIAVGYGAANSVLIEGPDSLIIIDTMYGTEAANQVFESFREISDKPVKAIIHTHSHSDHIGGTSIFSHDSQPDIYIRKVNTETMSGYDKLTDILSTRGKRQFGSELDPNEKIAGISPVIYPKGGIGEGKMKPTKYIVTDDRIKLNIAEINLEIVAAPGETDDHIYIWIPGKKVLICGDNFYWSFPNIYAIRGTKYRDVTKWISSLNKIIDEKPEYLISGHARPIIGGEKIRKTLTNYRDAISHVFYKTLEGMNNGLSPDEMTHEIELPDSLSNVEYLNEFYGVIDWSVRSIYTGYLGWFDGNPTNLFPMSPKEEAERILSIVGSEEKLIEMVENAIVSKDYQWACKLSDYLIAIKPSKPVAQLLKAKALRELADQQKSSNARHYYLSTAKEIEAKYR
jgi:uncharacterized sulfatase